MYSHHKSLLACLFAGIVLWTLGSTSCTSATRGSDNSAAPNAAEPISLQPGSGSLAKILEDAATGLGQVSSSKEGSAERKICVLEERHNSVAGQLEIALMLLRLHDRYGLRDIALEGLTNDKQFPSTKWFRNMGGPDDDELRVQVAVGLLRQGEISAVELIALALPDVVVHAADDATAYRVELTKKAGIASTAYLYKIGLKSVRPEHYERVQELSQQKKMRELVEYVISLDSWGRERYEQMKKDTAASIEQTLRGLQEIEDRAGSVGAEISGEERSSMAEARAFFDAAGLRTRTLVQTTLQMEKSAPLVALSSGAAHTEGIKRMLEEAKASYGVLTPLSLAQNLNAGDLSSEAFQRKNQQLSVAFTGNGLGSLLDGRRKPPPVLDAKWAQGESQLRYITALMARGAGGPNFPDPSLRKKVDGLDQVKVNWATVKKEPNGDVIFMASVLGENGWNEIWTRCGIPQGMALVGNRKGRTLEQLLLENLDEVRKEQGERTEPKKGPVVEIVTPDVLAAYAKEPKALTNVLISG